MLYIFGKEAIDMDSCMAALKASFPDKSSHIIIMYDVRYSHVIGKFKPQEHKFQTDVYNLIHF